MSGKFYERSERESELQADIIDLARVLGWFAQKVEFRGRTGGMDLICIRRGRHIWVEVKREGEEARRKQEFVAREMRSFGAEVYLVDTIADARRVLK